ncbi:MAG: hypothetical protein HYX69_17030 [Planctomycetia bacterium]|nr:hypothetical protein [Planctomycetia bacterium]
MRTYSFTLVLSGAGDVRTLADPLYEAGCDDALLGTQGGTVFLDFDREGKSLESAIRSAIHDVEKTGINVARVEPDDIVNASEISRRIAQTRESVRKYINGQRGPGSFPAPLSGVKTSSPLWRWNEVANWFAKSDIANDERVREANTIAALNTVLDLRRIINAQQVREMLTDFGIAAAKPTRRTRRRPAHAKSKSRRTQHA